MSQEVRAIEQFDVVVLGDPRWSRCPKRTMSETRGRALERTVRPRSRSRPRRSALNTRAVWCPGAVIKLTRSSREGNGDIIDD